MVSHRQDEIMCSAFRILRKSETGDCQMGVEPKTGLSSHSSSWTTSGSCVQLNVDYRDQADVALPSLLLLAAFESI